MSQRWVQAIDCQRGLKKLRSDIYSLVLTDPPYFIDGMGDEWNNHRLKQLTNKAGVIGSLPVGMKFDKTQGIRLQNFMTPIAKELLRILKPGGFFLCFTQNRLVHRMGMAIENAGFEIRDVLLWHYEGQAKAFSQDHFIRKRKLPESEKQRLIKKCGGRKTPQLKPQGELIVLAQTPKEGTFVDNWDQWEVGLIDVSNPYLFPNKFPGTVIPCKKPRNRHGHMTTKPVNILRHLIRIFTKKGGGYWIRLQVLEALE